MDAAGRLAVELSSSGGDDPFHFVDGEGADEDIVATEIEDFSPHGIVGTARCDHQRGRPLQIAKVVQHAPPVPVGHLTVRDHDLDGVAVKTLQSPAAIGSFPKPPAGALEDLAELPALAAVIPYKQGIYARISIGYIHDRGSLSAYRRRTKADMRDRTTGPR